MSRPVVKNPPPPKRDSRWQQGNNNTDKAYEFSEIRQLDVLEAYLLKQGYKYIRRPIFDTMPGAGEQIVVFDREGKRIWDAICGLGTYGGSHGLLEVMGNISGENRSTIQGWLTAEDIITRLERSRG